MWQKIQIIKVWIIKVQLCSKSGNTLFPLPCSADNREVITKASNYWLVQYVRIIIIAFCCQELPLKCPRLFYLNDLIPFNNFKHDNVIVPRFNTKININYYEEPSRT